MILESSLRFAVDDTRPFLGTEHVVRNGRAHLAPDITLAIRNHVSELGQALHIFSVGQCKLHDAALPLPDMSLRVVLGVRHMHDAGYRWIGFAPLGMGPPPLLVHRMV